MPAAAPAGSHPALTALPTTGPGSGSGAAASIIGADCGDGGYEITGQKAWTSNGGLAGQYVVLASHFPSLEGGHRTERRG